MRVVVISQARMSSTRLPGKVLMNANGKPLLQHHLERVQNTAGIADVVVATTTNPVDDVIENLSHKLGCNVYRGSEQDVLRRYHEAAVKFDADVVVRVTSDCPLLDPQVIERAIQHFLSANHATQFDYVSNTVRRTYPRGMDVEVFGKQVLAEMHRNARTPSEREHVTPWLYTRSKQYSIGCVTYHRDVSFHRWTVDTRADFVLIRRMLRALGDKPMFTLEDALALAQAHPDWQHINAHVAQKELGE